MGWREVTSSEREGPSVRNVRKKVYGGFQETRPPVSELSRGLKETWRKVLSC